MTEEDIAAILWMVVASTLSLGQRSNGSVEDKELAVIFRHWAAAFDSLTDAICAFKTSGAAKVDFSTDDSFEEIFLEGARDGKVVCPALYHVTDGRHLAQAHSFCVNNGAMAIHDWLSDIIDDAGRRVFERVQEALNESLSQLHWNLPKRNLCKDVPGNCKFPQKCRFTHNIQRSSRCNQSATGSGGQDTGFGRGGGGPRGHGGENRGGDTSHGDEN
jgi:hypothetical protein